MHEMFKVPRVILTPSSFIRDQFLKYYSFIGPKTRVLPLGIAPVKGERGTRAKNGKVRFCYFGNILPLKGVHLLVDAFRALPRGKSVLTIYGERNPWTAAYYDEMKERADGFPVDFRPPFRREDLAEALRDQDVVVLPSICPESFSFVIREAHAMGLPVIGSRIGAIPEAIEEGENGFLFEPGSVNALKECMLRFVEEPELAPRMATRTQKVKTMEEHALELEAIYREVIPGCVKGPDRDLR